MAELNGKTTLLAEQILISKDEYLLDGQNVKNSILITNGDKITTQQGIEIDVPKVISENIITAINRAQDKEHLLRTVLNNDKQHGQNTLIINVLNKQRSSVTISKCHECKNVIDTINGIKITDIFQETVAKKTAFAIEYLATKNEKEWVVIKFFLGNGLKDVSDAIKKDLTKAPFNGYDCSKGTVEERLEKISKLINGLSGTN